MTYSDTAELIGGRALQATWESGAEDEPHDWDELTDSEQQYWIDWMSDVLAALRDAGFDVYRPGECSVVWWCDFHQAAGNPGLDCWGAGINGQDDCRMVRRLLVSDAR